MDPPEPAPSNLPPVAPVFKPIELISVFEIFLVIDFYIPLSVE